MTASPAEAIARIIRDTARTNVSRLQSTIGACEAAAEILAALDAAGWCVVPKEREQELEKIAIAAMRLYYHAAGCGKVMADGDGWNILHIAFRDVLRPASALGLVEWHRGYREGTGAVRGTDGWAPEVRHLDSALLYECRPRDPDAEAQRAFAAQVTGE